MASKWRDVSSWSKYDTDRTPKTWELTIGRIKLCVTRSIYTATDEWLACCEPFLSQHTLKSKEITEAKREAELLLGDMLTNSLNALKRSSN